MALKVTINGQPREFEELLAGAVVLDLIAALGLKGDRVALELNGDIAARTAWGQMTLADGDKIEVVHFVGGGSSSTGCGGRLKKRYPRDCLVAGISVSIRGWSNR